jgi:hypothetical protein
MAFPAVGGVTFRKAHSISGPAISHGTPLCTVHGTGKRAESAVTQQDGAAMQQDGAGAQQDGGAMQQDAVGIQ